MDPVSDSAVGAIIAQALASQPSQKDGTIVDRVRGAFRGLQLRRRNVEPLNIDLAAAEHYMYARYLAGTTGDPTVRMAPALYGAKKRVYFALGIQDRMATTRQPVLPPNAAVERWGTKGAEQGLQDYAAVHGKPAANYGKALHSLTTEAARYN